ncbi:MAG: hypothetical protein LBK83_02410 [Treponema sp.]|jgi:hypothetical protein|nr:hypothetical protein [Treponema sp.]
MKKALVLFCCIMSAITGAGAQTEDGRYVLDFIDRRFIGYYISLDFVNTLEKTKHYVTARGSVGEYEYIIIFKDGIRRQRPSEDSYSEVSEEQARNYQFEYTNDREALIADETGTWYKRITGHTEYEAANKAVNHYIASVVLGDFLKKGELILEENTLLVPALNNRKFEVGAWRMWLEEEANLYLGDELNQWVYLELQGPECIMYRTIRWRGGKPPREVVSKEVIWRTLIEADVTGFETKPEGSGVVITKYGEPGDNAPYRGDPAGIKHLC